MNTKRILLALVLLAALAPGAASAQTVMPEWLHRSSDTWRGQREPQVAERGSLFRNARRTEGALDGALLVCRVHVDGSWDLFADPDLRVAFRVGSRRGSVWGSENSRTEVFSFPGVRLRRGGPLSFRIDDRDVTFDQHIATVRGRYDEDETRLGAGQAEVECRVVDPALVARRRDAGLARAEGALAAMERARPDLRAPTLNRPNGYDAQRAVVDAAAWVGWDDPGLSGARRRHDRALESFDEAVRAAVTEARRTAPAPGTRVAVDGGHATLERFECGRAARQENGGEAPCVAKLRLEGDVDPTAVDLLAPSGHVGGTDAPIVIETQDDARWIAVPVRDRAATRGLLRVGRDRTLVRLR